MLGRGATEEDRSNGSANPAAEGRGWASGAGALIEVEVRDGLGLAGVVCRRLVEIGVGIGVESKVVLGRAACGREGWRGGRQAEVCEDGVDGLGGGDEGEDTHVGAAVGAGEGKDLVDAGEEAGPAGAGGGALRESGGSAAWAMAGLVQGGRSWRAGLLAVSPVGSPTSRSSLMTRSRRRAFGARTPW